MSSNLEQLSKTITDGTSTYIDYLRAHNLPIPSHYDLPSEAPIALPDEVESARQAALEASHELHELLSGSVGIVMNAAARSTRIMVLHFIHTYKIGYSLAWNERTTFVDLAKKANLDPEDTKRMIRLAMTEHLFTEPENNVVMHTAASYELARNPLLAAWIGVTTQENWSPMLRLSEAMRRYPGSEEPLESAYALAHDLKEEAFATWEKDPQRIEQFSNAMAFLHAGSGFQADAVFNTLSSASGTFVDVGGSKGHVSIQLAFSHPKWRFVVQDSQQTVSLARQELPSDVAHQVSFEVHDFWTEQPLKYADVYFFKTIFHDWSDTYSVKILRALIPALKPGARVIIADVCIPPKGAISHYNEQWIRGLDIVMKCFTNAKERNAEDWAALFKKGDPRFKFLGVRTPKGSKASLIEAEWRPEVAAIINGSE